MTDDETNGTVEVTTDVTVLDHSNTTDYIFHLNQPVKVKLTGWFDTLEDNPFGIKALLFGEMVKLAAPVVRMFISDLYHDVHMIDKYVTGPGTFYYGVRSHGGAIFGLKNDKEMVYINNDLGYKLELVCEDGYWSVIITLEHVKDKEI